MVSGDAGERWEQEPKVTSNVGVWTGRLTYKDIPETTEDKRYHALFLIGTTYFQWTVDQRVITDIPPDIASATLVESNPDTDPRFTDQEFVASVNMTAEGLPVANKVIDAFVEGTITTQGQFEEPLESSAAGGDTNYGQYLSATNNWASGTPDLVFDGNPATYIQTFQTAEMIVWDVPPEFQSNKYWSATTPDSNAAYNWILEDKDGNQVSGSASSGPTGYIDIQEYEAVKFMLFRGDGPTRLSGIYANSLIVDGVSPTTLTFAAGTDMSFLEAGDLVQQPEQEIKPANLWSAFLKAKSGFNSPATRAFDGDFGESAVGVANGEEIYFQPGGTWTGTVSFRPVVYSLNVNHNIFIDNINVGFSRPPDADGLITFDVTNAGSFGIQAADGSQTTVTAMYWDGGIMIDNQAIAAQPTGTVVSTVDTTVTLSSSSGTWTDGVNVTGSSEDRHY